MGFPVSAQIGGVLNMTAYLEMRRVTRESYYKRQRGITINKSSSEFTHGGSFSEGLYIFYRRKEKKEIFYVGFRDVWP